MSVDQMTESDAEERGVSRGTSARERRERQVDALDSFSKNSTQDEADFDVEEIFARGSFEKSAVSRVRKASGRNGLCNSRPRSRMRTQRSSTSSSRQYPRRTR